MVKKWPDGEDDSKNDGEDNEDRFDNRKIWLYIFDYI